MFRKTITVFLLVSFLHFIGCYSSETISIKEIEEGTEQIDFGKDITIVTKDYNSYHFPAFQYQVNNDTLYGAGTQVTFGSNIPFKGKIALSDIKELNVEKLDAVASFGLAFGVAIIGLILVFVLETNKHLK